MCEKSEQICEGQGHTPGPWSDGIHHRMRSGGREYAYIRGGNDIVPVAAVPLGAEGYTVGFEQGVANARLIAAAPELLDAAKQAYEQMLHLYGKVGLTNLLRDVIAKAEGRS